MQQLYSTENNQILNLSVGNPNLTPESGSNMTYGFVWEPTNISFLEAVDFRMAVDNFELEIENAVVGSGVAATLNGCFLMEMLLSVLTLSVHSVETSLL